MHKDHVLSVRLTEQEWALVVGAKDRLGEKTVSDVIRRLLRREAAAAAPSAPWAQTAS